MAPDVAKTPNDSNFRTYRLPTYLRFYIRVWIVKAFTFAALKVLRIAKATQAKAVRPTKVKYYSVRSGSKLDCRVHLPPSFREGSKLPLYIDIHGGGFTIGNPSMDDEYCNFFARNGFCVVSINYHKAPTYQFPTQVNDCADMVHAVLNDHELPIDQSRIVIGGFSAGASLTLALGQIPSIKERVTALVPFYPATDWSNTYKGTFRPNKEGKPDLLRDTYSLFEFAYLKPGQDLTDPLLSPIYAGREKLSHPIFLICCEYDYLCREAHIMARMLAKIEDPENVSPDAAPEAWSKNGIKWRTVPDTLHAFTHVPARDAKEEAERKKVCTEIYQEVLDWLNAEVFAKHS